MPEKVEEHNKHHDLCEKCKDYMEVCESDEKSDYHFKYLQSIYKRLSTAKRLPEKLLPLLEMLEEFILKNDNDRISLDSKDMFRHNNTHYDKGGE